MTKEEHATAKELVQNMVNEQRDRLHECARELCACIVS